MKISLEEIKFDFIFRYHVPVVTYLLFHMNNLFLVINSSINFMVYYVMGKPFRDETAKLFTEWKTYIVGSFRAHS